MPLCPVYCVTMRPVVHTFILSVPCVFNFLIHNYCSTPVRPIPCLDKNHGPASSRNPKLVPRPPAV